MELTPRTAPGPADPSAPRRRRSPWAYGALVLVLVGIGVVAYHGLTSASLYFYNADEAYEQRAELGDERIRVQGLVRDDRETTEDGLTFSITFNGQDMRVQHDGDPPQLFEPGVPVVLEGRWAAGEDLFLSDEIFVKHDPEYEADNGDRLEDAEDGETGDPATP